MKQLYIILKDVSFMNLINKINKCKEMRKMKKSFESNPYNILMKIMRDMNKINPGINALEKVQLINRTERNIRKIQNILLKEKYLDKKDLVIFGEIMEQLYLNDDLKEVIAPIKDEFSSYKYSVSVGKIGYNFKAKYKIFDNTTTEFYLCAYDDNKTKNMDCNIVYTNNTSNNSISFVTCFDNDLDIRNSSSNKSTNQVIVANVEACNSIMTYYIVTVLTMIKIYIIDEIKRC